jgi:hypothetical protein
MPTTRGRIGSDGVPWAPCRVLSQREFNAISARCYCAEQRTPGCSLAAMLAVPTLLSLLFLRCYFAHANIESSI